MRKWQKALVGFLLVGCVGVSVSCGDEVESSSSTVTPPTQEQPKEEKAPYTVVADKYFVKSGETDYVIVIPEKSDDVLELAAQELRDFFNEATGARPIIYYDNQTIPEGKKYFSLGDTTLAASNVQGGNGGVENQGYRMVTVGDNMYILGNGNHGVIYGVYDLLGFMFHYEFFKENVYALDTGVTTLNFFTMDYKAAPDFTYRVGYSALSQYNHGINAMRYRLRSEWEFSAGDIHNSMVILDPAKYNNAEDAANYHPNWYNAAVDQLCYTAGGNEEERRAMIDTAADALLVELREDKTMTHAYFQMMDTTTWCKCTFCEESKAKYNAQSAAMLQVCQGIHERITEKLSAEGDDRQIKIVPLLYHATENVPVVKDETTGEYKLSDPSLNFDGVSPMWANLSAKEHEYAWQDEKNVGALDMLNQMEVAFENYWIWDYGIDFYEYLLPYNVFNNLSEDFQLLQDYNIELHLYQCDHSAYNSTGFGALKLYLISQLTWDADQDVEELTDNFFKYVYGDGGAQMREIYDQYRILAAYNSVPHGEIPAWENGVYSTTTLDSVYFPKGILTEWLELVDESYATIEPLKATDPEAYALYEKNIRAESIFVRYIYTVLYMENATDIESLDFKRALYDDFVALNFGRHREDIGVTSWDFAVRIGISSYL